MMILAIRHLLETRFITSRRFQLIVHFLRISEMRVTFSIQIIIFALPMHICNRFRDEFVVAVTVYL